MSGRGRLSLALVWVAALAFLSGSVATFLAVTLFLVGVALPCWLLLGGALRRHLADEQLVRILAAAATLVVITPLYMLRKAVPLPPPLADGLIAAAAWLVAARTRAVRGLGASLRSLMDSPARVYLAVVLPAAFCLSWLGYGVRRADSIDYFGLFYVDFGNLLSIVNVIRASPLLPTSPVAHSGALGYHWLYFAFPAWSSDFLGLPAQSANALIVADLFTASLLYAALVRTCERALEATGTVVDKTWLAPTLAAVALFGLSTLYVYQVVVQVLHRSWFTLGTRNDLLLQLPHSVIFFGHNTLALVLCLLVFDLLRSWSSSGHRRYLNLAAALTSVLPGYGILLVFPVGLAIGAWSLSGQGRRPVLTLLTFGGFAVVALAIFRAIGLLSYGSGGGGIVVSFDHGQFVQNVALGFFPVTFALAICLWKVRDRVVVARLSPYLFLLAACLVVPTMLMTRGSPTARVDFSMKDASLYLVAATPVFAVAAAWLLAGRRRHRVLGVIGAAIVLAGLGNAAAYVFQHALHRVLGRGGTLQSIPLDHHRALELVAREPARLILLDELSVPSSVADPAVMVGGKRTLVASQYQESVFSTSAVARENKAVWLAWKGGGYADERLAARLADEADLLISASAIHSAAWSLVDTFGDVRVYRSTRPRT